VGQNKLPKWATLECQSHKVPLATAMAPMLLAVAIFSLTLLVQTKAPKETITDELFAVLSAACLLGSATVTDSAMDSCKASFVERLTFLGGGYVLFCLAIGVISAAIPILYAERSGATPIARWRYTLFFLSLAVRRDWSFGKTMLLRVEGELALPSICNDLFAGSTLL
jgi:hypothetical protein